jgi:DNA polymerase
MSNLLFIDFESFYDSANGYTLNAKQKNHVSVLEYIRSPKFKVHGMGVASISRPPAWYSADELRDSLAGINWTETIIVAHNVKFDGAILAWHYGIVPKGYVCTQAMARALLGYKVKSHSLASVAEYFGLVSKGVMHTDGIRDLTAAQEADLAEYCLHDVELCRDIYRIMVETFPAGQYRALDWTVKAFIKPTLELDGDTLREGHKAETERRAKIFEEIGIPKKVFASNQQFAKLLEEKGFEVPMKVSPASLKNGGEQKFIPALAMGDQKFLDLRNTENAELQALCEARIAAKSNLLETRSQKLAEIAKFGKFPIDIQFSGAKQTHRYSGANGAGGNFQNLTRGSFLRRAVKAPKGYKLLVADFAAIEARIVAWLAREPKLIDAFTKNEDVYSSFASRIYQRPITKADKRERQFGKTCILGLGYGMGAKKFAYKVRLDTGMIIDEEEAKRVVKLYRFYYTRVEAFWQLLDHYIPYLASGGYAKLPGISFLTINKGCVFLPSGLPLQYPNLRWNPDSGKYGEWIYDVWDKGHIERRHLYGGKLTENISQALAGELTKLAIERAEDSGITCAAQVHDEILAIVPESEAAQGALALRRAMTVPPAWWPTIRLTAEVGIGDNWLEAKV